MLGFVFFDKFLSFVFVFVCVCAIILIVNNIRYIRVVKMKKLIGISMAFLGRRNVSA